MYESTENGMRINIQYEKAKHKMGKRKKGKMIHSTQFVVMTADTGTSVHVQ